MLDNKSVLLALRLLVERRVLVDVVKFVQEILVTASGETVEERKRVKRFFFDTRTFSKSSVHPAF